MNIQTATPDMTMLADGEFNKTYTGFTLASGLVEGMRVTVSGTNDTYTVKGRDKLDYGPMVPHFEVTLIKEGR